MPSSAAGLARSWMISMAGLSRPATTPATTVTAAAMIAAFFCQGLRVGFMTSPCEG
jgi:hypothetical protein